MTPARKILKSVRITGIEFPDRRAGGRTDGLAGVRAAPHSPVPYDTKCHQVATSRRLLRRPGPQDPSSWSRRTPSPVGPAWPVSPPPRGRRDRPRPGRRGLQQPPWWVAGQAEKMLRIACELPKIVGVRITSFRSCHMIRRTQIGRHWFLRGTIRSCRRRGCCSRSMQAGIADGWDDRSRSPVSAGVRDDSSSPRPWERPLVLSRVRLLFLSRRSDSATTSLFQIAQP
jgi:hypothetical protein